jgi:AraC-like DNA-binding protein
MSIENDIFIIFSDIIINAGIAHGFLIAIMFRTRKNQQARFLLSFLLIVLSLVIFRIHYLTQFLFDKLGSSFFLAGPFMFLLGPFLFLYLRSIVLPKTTVSRKDLIHFVVFAVFLVLVIPIYLYGKEGAYSIFLQRIVGSPWIFLVLQFGYYLIQARRLLRVHKKNIVEKFSNVEGMDVSWLSLIIWVFGLILFFITIATPLLIHGIDFPSYNKASAIFFSLILFFIAYKGIKQRIPLEITISNETDQEVTDRETILRLKEKLLTYMEANKPFLNPELTLIDLAKQIAISRNQLSQVINTGVGDNFYNFINKFRVEEVKELIKKDTGKQFTILSLANDAGFNSKSSFNNIFKKMTGLTPSEYRDGQS